IMGPEVGPVVRILEESFGNAPQGVPFLDGVDLGLALREGAKRHEQQAGKQQQFLDGHIDPPGHRIVKTQSGYRAGSDLRAAVLSGYRRRNSKSARSACSDRLTFSRASAFRKRASGALAARG